MIFFCDNSGAIFKTVPEKIYQGSVNANTIYFVGAFDGDCVVTARFNLPNGLITSEQIMPSAYLALGDNIQTASGEKYGVWSLSLKYPVTELSGTVNVQFSVTNANENGVAATVCTASSSFNVEKGVPILQDNSAKTYETLLTQIKAVLTALQQGDTENSIASAASAAAALASEQAAKASEQAAATSEENAKVSEENALASAQAAKTSEENAYSVAQSLVGDRKQIAENTLNIHNIQAVLQGNSQYAEITVSEAYASRVTANGANIFDNQLTPVESIKGSTVKCKNIFDINTTPHLSYPTYTTYSVDGDTVTFISTIANNSFYYKLENVLEVGKIYTFSVDSIAYTGASIGIWLGTTNAIDSNEYSKRIETPSGSITFTATSTDLYIKAYINYALATSGQTIFTFSKPMLVEGSQVFPYQTYFTGLKNANINSIVSTGKNLLPYPYVHTSKTQNGLTFTDNGNGSITINGTATASTLFQLTRNMEIETGVQYTINGGKEGITVNVRINPNDQSWLTSGNGTSSSGMLADGKTINYTGIYVPNGTVCNNVTIYPMFNRGGEIPYEPYTTYTYQLPQTVELAEYDTLYPEKSTIERFTQTKVFELSQGVWSMPDSGLFLYGGSLDFDATEPSGQGVCNLFAHNPEQSPIDMTWFLQNGNLYFVNKQISSIADWSSYLADKSNNGDPLTLAYRATTATTENINAPITYEADNGGTETINQGATDNSKYGAMPTITQTYLGKVGE